MMKSAKEKRKEDKLAQEEKELEELEMGQAKYKIKLFHEEKGLSTGDICIKGKKVFETGIDKVVFLLSPNPGEDLKPLSKIASGGELSRIVLALKAVLSSTGDLETLIFDEVDSGIGGSTSEKVGLKLKFT